MITHPSLFAPCAALAVWLALPASARADEASGADDAAVAKEAAPAVAAAPSNGATAADAIPTPAILGPLVIAEPPAAAPRRAKVATRPPPPRPKPAPPAPPKQRWYGWQALIVHGLTDSLLVTSVLVAEASPQAATGLVIGALAARPLGSAVVELVNDGWWGLAIVSSALLPTMGGGAAVAVDEGLGRSINNEDARKDAVRAVAVGMLVGGSAAAALEASFAFTDLSPLDVSIGPTGVRLTGAF